MAKELFTEDQIFELYGWTSEECADLAETYGWSVARYQHEGMVPHYGQRLVVETAMMLGKVASSAEITVPVRGSARARAE